MEHQCFIDTPDDYEEQLDLDLGLPDEDEDLTLTDIAVAAVLAGIAGAGLFWLGGTLYSRLRTA